MNELEPSLVLSSNKDTPTMSGYLAQSFMVQIEIIRASQNFFINFNPEIISSPNKQ